MEAKIGKLLILDHETREDSEKDMADSLGSYLCKSKENNIPVLLMLSGGSAFEVLKHMSLELLWKGLTITVLDERYDLSNQNNNFSQFINSGFYGDAKKAGCSFIDTSVKDGQTQDELADFFEHSLRSWMEENSNGVILATAGIGRDGHASGIMPFSFPREENEFNRLFESDKFIASYDAGEKSKFEKRITTTNTFLRKIGRIFIFLSGSEKKEAFLNFKKDGLCVEVPSRVLKEINGMMFIDASIIK